MIQPRSPSRGRIALGRIAKIAYRDTGDPDDFDPDGRRRRGSMELGRWPWGVSLESMQLASLDELVETLRDDWFPGFDDETRRGFKIAWALVNRPAMRHAVLARHAWAYSPERLFAFLWFHEAMCLDEARAGAS